jgi:Na+-driven multidrug efflux pump
MMRLFTPDAELIRIGAEYLRNISVAYFCWGLIETYLATLRSVGRVGVSTALNSTAFSLNILLNAVFICAFAGMRFAPVMVPPRDNSTTEVELISFFSEGSQP